MSIPEFSLLAFGRLAGVLLRPRLTFAQIVSEPTWVAPLIFIVVAWLTASILWVDSGMLEQVYRRQLTELNVPAEQAERIIKNATERSLIRDAVNLGLQFVRWAIAAAILLGTFRVVTTVQFSYKTCFAVFSHSLLPASGLGMFFVMAQALLQDPAQARPLFGTWSFFGILFSREMPFLQIMLGMFSDALNVWSLMLMSVGFSTVNQCGTHSIQKVIEYCAVLLAGSGGNRRSCLCGPLSS